jgi:hypothetical protein
MHQQNDATRRPRRTPNKRRSSTANCFLSAMNVRNAPS